MVPGEEQSSLLQLVDQRGKTLRQSHPHDAVVGRSVVVTDAGADAADLAPLNVGVFGAFHLMLSRMSGDTERIDAHSIRATDAS